MHPSIKQKPTLSHFKNYRVYLALLIIIFGIFFINYWIPFFADDYSYHYVYGEAYMVRNLNDVFISQYRHYMHWGGRSIVHGILQVLFISNNLIVLTLFKTISFVVLSLLIFYLTTRNGNFDPYKLLAIMVCYWVFHPNLGECNFWITGTCNYLVGPLLGLFYLIPFTLNYKRLQNYTFLSKVLWIFVALLAGWSNENYSISLFFLTAYFVYINYKSNQKLPFFMYPGIILFTIGMFFLILAPGNEVRYYSFDKWHSHNFFYRYGENIIFFLRGELLQVFVILFFRYLYIKNTDLCRKELALVFFVTAIIADAIMILTPTFAYRTLASGYILKLVAVFTLYEEKFISRIKLFKTIILSIFILEFAYALYGYHKLFIENNYRLMLIQHSNKNELLKLPLFSFKEHSRAIVFVRDLNTYKGYWTNNALSQYYGLKQGVVGSK